MQNYIFVDFRIEKLRKFLNNHREHNVETIIGEGNCDKNFRFIVCRDCNEVYFVGII